MDNLPEAAFFALGTAALVFVSRESLLRPRSHGFHRFFAWECLLALFLLNMRAWFRDPLAWHQLISWALLVLSLFIGTVTLATGRTTILQGAVHLVIFAVFLFLAAVP